MSEEKVQATPKAHLERGWQWVRKNNFRILYWAINLIVMAYSAQNGGHLFGKYESVGIILPLIFDALIIVFTQALLAAKARGDGWRVFQILMFILLCTGINLVANVYASLESNIQFAPTIWIAPILPYVVSCMPIFLFCLALIADYVGMSVIKKPAEEEMAYIRHDPEQFKKREMNRLKIKLTKVRMRELSAMIDTRAAVLAAIKRKENKGHYKKLSMEDLQGTLKELNAAIDTIIVQHSEPNQETPSEQILAEESAISEQPSEQIEVPGVDASVDGEESAEVNETGNTEESPEETPKARITVKLGEQPSEQSRKRERTTDELLAVNKTVSSQRTTASTADAQKRVLRMLKKYPNIGPTELAQRANVSKSYASKIKAQVAAK